MMIIGLTGSIAMGKSEVANMFREAGIPVFDADREVHALYASAEGANLLRPLVPSAVTTDGVDRSKLAAAVMADETLLPRIEPLVHAEVTRRRSDFTRFHETQGTPIILFDIPLLFEKGAEQEVDVTVVVSAPAEQQRKRALARPGMTPEKFDMILSRQMPDAEKRKRAHHIIDNAGTLEDLRTKTNALIAELRQKEAHHA